MIKITFKNGEKTEWCKSSYDDYRYDGKCFIIVKDGQWVGIYNLDSVMSVEVTPEA